MNITSQQETRHQQHRLHIEIINQWKLAYPIDAFDIGGHICIATIFNKYKEWSTKNNYTEQDNELNNKYWSIIDNI